MKIKDLKKILELYNDETQIILSRDAEGNRFSPLADVNTEFYIPQSTWSGIIVHPDDLKERGDKATKVLVLFPTN